jgi:hypothetical protein
MPATAHTDGPWSVFTETEASGIYRGVQSVYIIREGCAWPDSQIARVNIQDGMGEREANARLIAAAPKLLATAEKLEPYLDAIVCYASDMGEHEPNRIAFEFRQALAAARGQS